MKRAEIPQIILLIVFFLGIYFNSSAQHNHDLDHDHHSHDEHKSHFGVGAGFASFSGEDGLEPSLHVHLLRKFNTESNWSLGLGYEGIKGEETWHNGFNLLLNYRPFKIISFNAGPGIVFEKEDGKNEILPAFHAESVVEFTFSDIHFGPMVGFGINKEHTHFSFGLHLGFGI
jgi:hypothetical protein